MFTTNVCRCAMVVFHCISISAIASADLVHSNRSSASSSKQSSHVIATLDLSKTLAKSMTTSNISSNSFSSTAFSSAHSISLPAVFASKEHTFEGSGRARTKSDVQQSSQTNAPSLRMPDIYKAVSNHHHDDKSGSSHSAPICDPVAVPEPSALLLSLSTVVLLGTRIRHSRRQSINV